MVLGGIKKERRQRLLATQFKRSISCVKNKHLPSTNYLTATPLSSSRIFFFHKFLLCSSGNQAAKHVGLLIQYYSSFVPSAAQHRGVTLGQIHKGAPSFHLRAAVSLPASPPPLSSSYLRSAAHCTMYRATGMRLNAWHPQPVFFWAASAQQHSPAQQQG